MSELLGLGVFIDAPDLLKLLSRLALDLGVTAILVLAVYRRLYKSQEFVFTYFTFNVITFSMCLLLSKVPMELGFALGLFAVFGILRYRTEAIRMRDLTYMFIVIGVAIINAVANREVSLVELMVVNGLILGITWAVEMNPRARRQASTPLLYDDLSLLRPERLADLHADITRRTGLDVVKVEIHRIDLLRDSAELTVYHQAPLATQPATAPEVAPARPRLALQGEPERSTS
ncbi:MAG: DUF4956 domain-containing protein [Deltaproteobacteria bacterium]|nr:DUF4956 domain-containing protein [Deltaproteobacteria bacterium]